ncbi:MAG: hypothetical protein PHC60_08455 [Heliobacteriaceae bacterium]|nr:hypothetical protein [Heliobacteriaceae bacterium]
MRNKALIKIAITAFLAVMVSIPVAAAAGEAMISLGVYQDPAKGSLQLTAVLAVPAGTNPKTSDFTFTLTDPAGQIRSLPAPVNFYWRPASQTATFEFFTLPADLFNQTVTIQAGYGGSTREVTVTLRPSGSTGGSLLGVASVNTDGKGELTVMLNGLPRREPTSGDFTVTHTINGVPVPAAPVLGVALKSWDRATRTAVLTVPVVSPDPELDQIVVYYVAFNNTAAVKAPPVPVQAAPPAGKEPLQVQGVTLNPDNTLTLTLNKYPGALWPTGYFSVQRSINGFFPTPLPPDSLRLLRWEEASGKPVAVLALPPLPAYPSRQTIFVTVASPLGLDTRSAYTVMNVATVKVSPNPVSVYALEEAPLEIQVLAGGRPAGDATLTLMSGNPAVFTVAETVSGTSGSITGLQPGIATLTVTGTKAGWYVVPAQITVNVLSARVPEITAIPADKVYNDQITVQFSGRIGQAQAADFTINPPLGIMAVEPQDDGRSVLVTMEPQIPGTVYTLTYKGVRQATFTGRETTGEPRIEDVFVLSPTSLRVVFNQTVPYVLPGDFSAYSGTGYVRVLDAVMLQGNRSAMLTLDPLSAGEPYVLVYKGSSKAFTGAGEPVKVTVIPEGGTQKSLSLAFDPPVPGPKPGDFRITPGLAVLEVIPGEGGATAVLITGTQVAGEPYLLQYTGAAAPVPFLGGRTTAIEIEYVQATDTLGEFTFVTNPGVARESLLDGSASRLYAQSETASQPVQVTALNREGTLWKGLVTGVRYGTAYRLTGVAPLLVRGTNLWWNGIEITRLEPVDLTDPARGIRLETDQPVTAADITAAISLIGGPACVWKQSDTTGQVFILVPDPPASQDPRNIFVKGQTYTLTLKAGSRFCLRAGLDPHVTWPWP